MTFFQILLPVVLISIGIVDIQFRRQLAEIILAGLGQQADPDWGKTLETVQLVSGIGFIVVGAGLALMFWLGLAAI